MRETPLPPAGPGFDPEKERDDLDPRLVALRAR
jgi:hypothetical protein